MAQDEAPRKATQRQPAEGKQPPLKLSYTALMSLQLLCMNVQLKLERLRLTHSLRGKGPSSEVDELIQMIGRIYKRSNLKALMSGLFTEIATFFNFKDMEAVEIEEGVIKVCSPPTPVTGAQTHAACGVSSCFTCATGRIHARCPCSTPTR